MMNVQVIYDRPGKGVTVFDEQLVYDRPDVKVLLLSRYGGDDVVAEGQVILAAGAPVIWFVFPETWYDIGRFHNDAGDFTGFYTNLCTPVEIDGARWKTRDLFLDLWQPAGGGHKWLDEAELRDAVKTGLLDRATAKRVRNEQSLLNLQLGGGAWPPAIARDFDLPHVRALLDMC